MKKDRFISGVVSIFTSTTVILLTKVSTLTFTEWLKTFLIVLILELTIYYIIYRICSYCAAIYRRKKIAKNLLNEKGQTKNKKAKKAIIKILKLLDKGVITISSKEEN